MISSQIIQESLEDLTRMTQVGLWVCDTAGNLVAATREENVLQPEVLKSLLASVADNIEVMGQHFFKVCDQRETIYILAAYGGEKDAYLIGKIAVAQLQRLMTAYKEKVDRNSFIQSLLMDNLLLVDIYNRAKLLHVETQVRRIVYVIETWHKKDNNALETVKSIFSQKSRHFVTEVDECSIILVKELGAKETIEDQMTTASMLVDMLNAEAMSKVRVSFGNIVNDIKEVSRSYKEARMALEVGRIFYAGRTIIAYHNLGIGRLIYQLPMSLCDLFLEEVFSGKMSEEVDEETLNTINQFFEHNLNISETARQLYVHRNTLTYRLEKIEKLTGLDVKNFEDAMTFKIALMVASYRKFMEEK